MGFIEDLDAAVQSTINRLRGPPPPRKFPQRHRHTRSRTGSKQSNHSSTSSSRKAGRLREEQHPSGLEDYLLDENCARACPQFWRGFTYGWHWWSSKHGYDLASNPKYLKRIRNGTFTSLLKSKLYPSTEIYRDSEPINTFTRGLKWFADVTAHNPSPSTAAVNEQIAAYIARKDNTHFFGKWLEQDGLDLRKERIGDNYALPPSNSRPSRRENRVDYGSESDRRSYDGEAQYRSKVELKRHHCFDNHPPLAPCNVCQRMFDEPKDAAHQYTRSLYSYE